MDRYDPNHVKLIYLRVHTCHAAYSLMVNRLGVPRLKKDLLWGAGGQINNDDSAEDVKTVDLTKVPLSPGLGTKMCCTASNMLVALPMAALATAALHTPSAHVGR
jgi:hypothetical protein